MNILVVGAGCTGASAARYLADKGWQVTLIDRRNHLGGNAYDCLDQHGQLYHRYGPHIFFTDRENVWLFLSQFGTWVPYQSTIGVDLCGRVHSMPFQPSILEYLTGNDGLAELLPLAFPGCKCVSILQLMHSSHSEIREAGQKLYEMDCVPYNKKQWNLAPDQLLPEILARAPVYLSSQETFRTERWQYMPLHGFTNLFKEMLNHPNIQICLNSFSYNWFTVTGSGKLSWVDTSFDCVLYTGALDELFEQKYGKLPYRSLHFQYETVEHQHGLSHLAIYYPDLSLQYTRRTDYSFIPGNTTKKHLIVSEIPVDRTPGMEPFYVVRTPESEVQSNRYRALAKRIPHFYFAGRLAEFRYLNMDDAIDSALSIAMQIDSAERM